MISLLLHPTYRLHRLSKGSPPPHDPQSHVLVLYSSIGPPSNPRPEIFSFSLKPEERNKQILKRIGLDSMSLASVEAHEIECGTL